MTPAAPSHLPAATPARQRVVSGMRPTGALHLGHYHGALQNWVRLQAAHECFYFVADWHAMTTHYRHPQDIEKNVYDMVVDWLGAGVDPERATLFIQSRLPEHAELFTLLAMGTPLAWLERVPTYKDRLRNAAGRDLSTIGFLGYPLLQAADILIYKAELVPVGEDQAPHVEITREVARRFNHLYGRRGASPDQRSATLLPEPATLLTAMSRLPGLDGAKMSKSDNNHIAMRDEPAEVHRKMRRMQTDPARVHRSDKGDPDRCPVWQFHRVYSDAPTQAWAMTGCTTAGIGCLDCKQPVIDAIVAQQRPWRERAEAYLSHPKQVQWIVEVGTERARAVARQTMREVRTAMGLTY